MNYHSKKIKFTFVRILSILLLFYSQNIFAQHETLPVLFKERPTIKNDTILVDWYFNVSVGYHLSDFKKCIIYGDSCINLAIKTKQHKHLINALNNVGGAYQAIGDYTKSLEYLYKALRVAEYKNDKMIIAYALDNIGITLQIMKRYEQALDYQLKSLKLEIEIEDFYGVGTSCINIGQTYLFLNDFAKAEEYYFKALEIGKQYQHKLIEAYSYNSIAQLFFEKKEFKTALKYNIAALKLFESIQDRNGTTNALLSIATIYYELSDYKNAKIYLQRAVNDATLFDTKQSLRESYKLLSEANEKLGNISEALKYHKLYTECNDSIYNEKSINIITEMSTKYETEKKDAENLILTKNKEIQEKEIQKQGILKNSFIFGFIFALLFLILLLNRYRIKQKANYLLNAQKNEILKQKEYLQILNSELEKQKEEITAQSKVIKLEKEKSDKLLLNILPAETATELKNNGFAKPRLYESVSILFTDFKGFTNACTGLTPKQVVDELHNYFEVFDEIVEKHKLEKIKTIGDAYMCACGLPVENNNHAINIVNAGIEMQEFMKKMKEKKISENSNYWELRLGINSGSVVAGVVGKKKFAYDIWGSAVNIASRMEMAGEVGRVNISENTYKLVKDTFVCEHRGKIQAKSVGAIDMYFVNGKL